MQLSDTDVESVIRKTVLRKKPEQESAISKCMDANQGELARHLQNTRFAATHDDDQFFVADYPLLPTRRRFLTYAVWWTISFYRSFSRAPGPDAGGRGSDSPSGGRAGQ